MVETTSQPGTEDRAISLSRVFDAPRALVWKAWTDPEHLVRWWGPRGFTNTFREIDIRPGGVWRFVMHGPDGRDYPNVIVFREVVEPERLAYAHGDEDDPDQFETTVTFVDEGGKTRVTMRSVFPSAEARDHVIREYGAIEGGNQTLDKLGEELARMSNEGSTGREFVVTRQFNAPRELVWKAWTEAERLAHWWGPKGMDVRVLSFDLRPGGVFHYSMRTPDGQDWFGKFVYREISPPERLVFVVSFADADGNEVRAPFSDTWPLEVQSTVTLEERDGKTTIALRGIPINANEFEHAAFRDMFDSMQQGWGGTLDQLEAYLAAA